MIALLAVLAVFLGIVPLILSLVVCAPKWYEAKIRSQLERVPILGLDVSAVIGGWLGWLLWPVALIGGPFIILFMSFIAYTVTIKNLIKWKCPYTSAQSYEEAVNRWDDVSWSDVGEFISGWWDVVALGRLS